MGEPQRDALPADQTGRLDAWLGRAFCGVFLGYLAAVAAWQRDFARMGARIGGVPLFTGEATLLVLLLLLAWITCRRRRLPFGIGWFEGLVAVFLAAGAAFTVRGLLLDFGVAALRDAALASYASFALFAVAFRSLGGRLEQLTAAIVVGANVGAVVWAVRFLTRPSLVDGHGVPAFAGIVSWLGILGIVLAPATSSWLLRLARLGGLAACSVVVFLSAYRTMVGVVVASVVGLAVVAGWTKSGLPVRGVVRLGVWSLVIAMTLLAASRYAPPPALPLRLDGPQPLSHAMSAVVHRWLPLRGLGHGARSIGRAADGAAITQPIVDPSRLSSSMAFRRRAWTNAVRRIEGSPLTGIGFGPPAALFPDIHCQLASGPLSNCGNAHNTYLTVALRMGLPAFTLFLLINGAAVAEGARQLRTWSPSAGFPPLAFSATAYTSFVVYGGTSLLLESPYLATVFWALAGALPAVRDDQARSLVASGGSLATAAAISTPHSGATRKS